MVQDSWKITTMDVCNIIDNNDGYREGVVRGVRQEMTRRGWLGGNLRASHEQAEYLGQVLKARISDLGDSYLIEDTLVHELWTLALNRIDWAELGRRYFDVVKEG